MRASTRWYASSLVLITLGVLRAVGDIPFDNLVKLSSDEPSLGAFITQAFANITYSSTPFMVHGPATYAIGLLYLLEFGAFVLAPLLPAEGQSRSTGAWILFLVSSIMAQIFTDTSIELPLIRRRLDIMVIEEYETMDSFGKSTLALAALVAVCAFTLGLIVDLIISSGTYTKRGAIKD